MGADQFAAAEAAAVIQHQTVSAEELTRSCLAPIDARDPTVRAWLHIDHDMVIRTASEPDKLALAGIEPKSLLHGSTRGREGRHRQTRYATLAARAKNERRAGRSRRLASGRT